MRYINLQNGGTVRDELLLFSQDRTDMLPILRQRLLKLIYELSIRLSGHAQPPSILIGHERTCSRGSRTIPLISYALHLCGSSTCAIILLMVYVQHPS